MTPPTYYTTLSLSPHASPSAIRSAYKSHALTSHPDKTLHLPASARATHAALFRRVQEAYDVLSNPALRAAYDRELARHGGAVDVHTSTFHRPETPSAPRTALTSPERKASLRKRAQAELEELRARRERRDEMDAKLDGEGLRILLAVWTDMVGEFGDEGEGSQELRAYCAVQVQVYLAKIAEREEKAQEASPQNVPREDGVEGERTAKRGTQREDAGRLAKAAAVRGKKEAQRKGVEERDRREAERVARVRGMAGAPVLKGAGAARREGKVGGDDAGNRASSSRRKCARCGGEHRGFVEWKRCAREGGVMGGEEDEEERFFRTV